MGMPNGQSWDHHTRAPNTYSSLLSGSEAAQTPKTAATKVKVCSRPLSSQLGGQILV